MTERIAASYYVVRYMLDELRDEAANVGVILATSSPERLTSRFLDDLGAKSRPDSRVDAQAVEDFREWVEDWELRITEVGQNENLSAFQEQLRERSGNVIRVSGPRTVLLADADVEADALFTEWVAPRVTVRGARPSQPRDPLAGIRGEAQRIIRRTLREGIRTLGVRRLVTPDYEVPGKIHVNKFDAAFVPPKRSARVQIFHHVLVLPDAEDTYDQAAALARRWLDVREVGNHKQLTAVLYSRENPTEVSAPDATQLLKNDKINVVNVARLRSVAAALEPQGDLLLPKRTERRGRR